MLNRRGRRGTQGTSGRRPEAVDPAPAQAGGGHREKTEGGVYRFAGTSGEIALRDAEGLVGEFGKGADQSRQGRQNPSGVSPFFRPGGACGSLDPRDPPLQP